MHFSYFEALLACEGKAKRNDESYEAFAGRVVDTIYFKEKNMYLNLYSLC